MRNIWQQRATVTRSTIALTALLLPLTAAAPATAQDRVSGQLASITATGRAAIRQDRAWVEIFVTAEAKTPAEAFATHAALLTQIVDQVAAKGYAGTNVEPGLLAIRPRYEVKREGARESRGPLVGYVVSKPVFVFIDDPARVADFVAGMPLSGAVRVGNVGFYAHDAKVAAGAAITDSIKRAQAAAAVAATATNRKIGAVSGLSLSLNDRVSVGGRPSVRTLQSWQNQQSPTAIESNDFNTRLILEPGEETAQQSVRLELQLR